MKRTYTVYCHYCGKLETTKTPNPKENTKMTSYNELNAKLSGRNANGRKIGNNTYAERRGDSIAIRLHSTDILTFNSDGSLEANSGGWKTVTTKSRLNEYLPNGFGIGQTKGIWYWNQYNGQFKTLGQFTDGDKISPEGKLQIQAEPDEEKKTLKLRKRILKYAKLCADSVPLSEPGNGDCWYCHMVTTEDETLGDSFKNTDHLESHMDESYVVPSLVFHAMKEKGWTTDKIPFAAAFGHADFMLDIAKREVKTAVARYMYRRYSLAG